MHRSDQTHVAFGGALLAVGLGGVIALVLGNQEGDWGWPLLGLLSVLASLAAVGAYVLAAVYLPGFWLPPTRAERELTPRLSVYEAAVDHVSERELRFHIGFVNAGRGRIADALVEVHIPAKFGQIEGTDEYWRPTGAGTYRSSKSLEVDEAGNPAPSIYWYGYVDFNGRVSRPLYFRAERASLAPVLQLLVRVTAEELDDPLVGRYALPISEEASS